MILHVEVPYLSNHSSNAKFFLVLVHVLHFCVKISVEFYLFISVSLERFLEIIIVLLQ